MKMEDPLPCKGTRNRRGNLVMAGRYTSSILSRPSMKHPARTFQVGRLVAVIFVAPFLAASAQHPSHGIADSTPSTSSLHTRADVRFMQQMIPHHAQALDMSALVPQRTDRREFHLIAERIDVSQRDEIAFMQRWLQDRSEEVPSLATHHLSKDHHQSAGHHHTAANHEMAEHHQAAHNDAGGQDQHGGEQQKENHEDCGCEVHSGAVDHALMPGMLTPQEMAKLGAATGEEFERLFLVFMIRHHEGALTMVADLLSSQGAAQEPEIFRFASDVDADQRAEIKRMRSLLEAQDAGKSPER